MTVMLEKTRAALVQEYLDALNAKEAARREQVNAHHLAEYGRLLYPEGGQYATFYLDTPGRKFTRVVMDVSGQRSVHAFIDNQTGDVLKSAGWKAPAKGVRFSLTDDSSRATLLVVCEFTGGYLYAR